MKTLCIPRLSEEEIECLVRFLKKDLDDLVYGDGDIRLNPLYIYMDAIKKEAKMLMDANKELIKKGFK